MTVLLVVTLKNHSSKELLIRQLVDVSGLTAVIASLD
jgi:hypothetical protein